MGPDLQEAASLGRLWSPVWADPYGFGEPSKMYRRGSQGRVFATGNEAARSAYSGKPAFRRPSISRCEFDCPPRAIHPDIVKVGSTSSTRAAASRA